MQNNIICKVKYFHLKILLCLVSLLSLLPLLVALLRLVAEVSVKVNIFNVRVSVRFSSRAGSSQYNLGSGAGSIQGMGNLRAGLGKGNSRPGSRLRMCQFNARVRINSRLWSG